MEATNSHIKSYILTAALGAIGGALLVNYATKAIPRMMSEMMS